VVHRDLKERRLHLIRPAEAPLYSKIALVRRKSRFVPRSVQAFVATARSLESRELRLLTAGPPSRGVIPKE
jgi:hypothetical protein